MTNEEAIKTVAQEIVNIGDPDTIPTVGQLYEAFTKAAERIGYGEWEDSMGDYL